VRGRVGGGREGGREREREGEREGERGGGREGGREKEHEFASARTRCIGVSTREWESVPCIREGETGREK